MKNKYPSIKIKQNSIVVIAVILFSLSTSLKGKTLPLDGNYTFLSTIINTDDLVEDPIIEDQSFSIDEGSAAGSIVGQVKASDDGSIANYAITKAIFLKEQELPKSDSSEDPDYNAAKVFEINASTGEITVANNKYLLFVLGPIELEVQVTDDEGAKSSGKITVEIMDLEVTITDNYTLDWSEVKAHPRGNEEATGGIVNGKLYVFGGFQLPNYAPREDVDVYDPTSDSWEGLQDMPPMADDSGAGGATHMGWAEDGENIYIAAGYAADKSGNTQQFGARRVYRYNVAEDDYTELPKLPIDRSAGALEFLNDKLYYIAGTNRARNEDQGDVFVLDLNDLDAGWGKLSPMPNPRHHIGSAIYDGKIYIFGGQKEHDEKLKPQDDVHRYDPATDTWEQVTDMPKSFNHIHASVFTYGDMIYSIGGQIGHLKGAYADVYGYNPKTNTWVQFTDLPQKRFAIVCGAVDGRIYASGGNRSRATFTAMLPEEVLGLKENDKTDNALNGVKVYPNPAKDELFIHFVKVGENVENIQVIDLNGRVLFEKKPNLNTENSDLKIPTASFSSGIYLLKVQDFNGNAQTSRFVVE